MKQSKFKRKYRAIIFDVDGTLIPNKKDGMPSKKVEKAIARASRKIKISIATSRPSPMAIHIIKHLSLTAPCILSGGGHIYDPVKEEIIEEILLDSNTFRQIKNIVMKLKYKGDIYDSNGSDYPIDKYIINKPMHFWTGNLSPKKADILFKELSQISTISVHKLSSWKIGNFDVMATPIEATKQQGILKVSEILGIETHEIIGVGDGYNDFPLLMACGLKIAMGNSVPELKEIADYIAPSVEEDGVADIIEKFILKNEKPN